ncbi:MAG: hypothetical protein B7Z74_08940, partial [Deltaproteobacteria bacterium 21-66-5]
MALEVSGASGKAVSAATVGRYAIGRKNDHAARRAGIWRHAALRPLRAAGTRARRPRDRGLPAPAGDPVTSL